MAITVKDIRNKQFTAQRNGYNKDEVDDFLDELADQLEALIKENLGLAKQLKERPVIEREAEPVIIEKPVEAPVREYASKPDKTSGIYDEPSYFKNLEVTLRETLINAQRVADETVAEARKKSKQMVASAEEQSGAMIAQARAEADAAKQESDDIRKFASDYKSKFLHLVEEQVHLLKADASLFD